MYFMQRVLLFSLPFPWRQTIYQPTDRPTNQQGSQSLFK